LSLKHSYALIAPFYDAFLTAATHGARGRSLAPLADHVPGEVLIAGIGTGLDIPHLPPQHRYVGIDVTRAMLAKAKHRAIGLSVRLVQGDVQRLPFPDAHFDAVVLHLILAVVPDPKACLAEAARVLKPGGHVFVFDKFLKPGERALWKRAMNPFTRHVATRLDVVFEEVLSAAPQLERHYDEPALAGGWFRLIRLRKSAQVAYHHG
jgi:phosphatidylethanolamine/phosphatidyl-N-methylethanolamine N-methyltransferase